MVAGKARLTDMDGMLFPDHLTQQLSIEGMKKMPEINISKSCKET